MTTGKLPKSQIEAEALTFINRVRELTGSTGIILTVAIQETGSCTVAEFEEIPDSNEDVLLVGNAIASLYTYFKTMFDYPQTPKNFLELVKEFVENGEE